MDAGFNTRLMKMEFCYHGENVAAKVYLVQSILSLYKLSIRFQRASFQASYVRLKRICQVEES